MNFIIRFLLGLPPRPSDVAELRQIAPELCILGADGQEFVQRLRAIDRELLLPFYMNLPALVRKLHAWAATLPELPNVEEFPLDAANCPLKQHCPLRADNRCDAEHSGRPIGDTELQIIRGGPQGNLARQFFALVQKNASGLDPESIRRVILTDAYIHDSGGETGQGKGYDRLIDYLTTVGADKNPDMRVELTPAPKKGNADKMNKLRQRLKLELGLKDVCFHSTRAAFHDRFYLLEDDKAQLRGVCGPSLNGLDSDRPAVVLLRELDSDETKTLAKYLV